MLHLHPVTAMFDFEKPKQVMAACGGERITVARTGTYTERISQQFLQLYQEEEHADFTVHTPGKSFRCHKLILSANSPFIQSMLRMFKQDMAEGDTPREMELESVPAEVFEVLLRYFYTGEVDFTEELLVPIVNAACFLGLRELKELCLGQAVRLCKPANAQPLLQMAKWNDLVELRDKAEYIIATCFRQIAALDSFKELSEYEVRDLLVVCEERDGDADHMYEAMVRWVKHDETGGRMKHLTFLRQCFDIRDCSMRGFYTLYLMTQVKKFDDMHILLETDFQTLVVEHAQGIVRHEPRMDPCAQVLVVGEQDCRGGAQNVCWGWEDGGLKNKFELPTHGSNFGACVTESGFAVSGGEDCRMVSAYDAREGVWGYLPELPAARHLHGMVCIGKQLFVLGGKVKDDELTASVQCLEMLTDDADWRDEAEIPSGPVQRPQITALRRGFFLLDVTTPQFLYYDVPLAQWTAMSCLSRYEPGARMLRAGKDLIVAGGKVTLRYNIRSNTWTSFFNPPKCCYENPAVVFAENTLWVFGDPKDKENSVWRYHISTNTWTKSSPKVPPYLRNLHTLTLHL